MAVRILHCGKSIENYNLCAEKRVAGFTKRVAEKGDIVYVAVKVGKSTICGVRGRLDEVTMDKPWEDSDRYVQAFKMIDVEFCKPFDLKILAEPGGQYWPIKYIQGSKEIKDERAIELLEQTFVANKQESLQRLEEDLDSEEEYEEEYDEEEMSEDEVALQEHIKIMGTFETVRFLNETDPYMGLENSVNNYFYELFPDFPCESSLLIKENKMFKTSGVDSGNKKNVSGIQGIPDALLIKYTKDDEVPLKVILIEYECYGEAKIKTIEKFNYLNGHIIPQLMRFASTFSIVTDRQIREKTVKLWTDKIMSYIYEDISIRDKVTSWIKELYPDIDEQQIALKLNNLLIQAFQTNLGIMLIIDELNNEQRDTIKNIIGSFKLENSDSISFYGYVVRLEQKINVINESLEYALSVQQFY